MKPAPPSARSPDSLLSRHVRTCAEIVPGVHRLGFEPTGPFRAGQVVAVRTAGVEGPRLYSLISGERSAEFEILYDVKPEGSLTPRLAALRPGDPLEVSTPFGEFLRGKGPAWCLAAGTGIAPFWSMLRSGQLDDAGVVHSARTASRFYGADEFRALGARYVRCCSREAGTGMFHGRLTDWLAQTPLPEHTRFMLCGSAEFIVAVREHLLSRTVPLARIQSEIYF